MGDAQKKKDKHKEGLTWGLTKGKKRKERKVKKRKNQGRKERIGRKVKKSKGEKNGEKEGEMKTRSFSVARGLWEGVFLSCVYVTPSAYHIDFYKMLKRI